MKVRLATSEDAEEGIEVLHRSITDLCALDHGNDRAELSEWLENKTIETWAQWLADPDIFLFVAEIDRRIVGVSMMTTTGEIRLNYVSPDMQYRGISKAMMQAMEVAATERGLICCTLTSTRTAKDFYLSLGYVPGLAQSDELVMRKAL